MVLHPRASVNIIYPIKRHEEEISCLIGPYRDRVNAVLLAGCDSFGLITIDSLNSILRNLLYTVGTKPGVIQDYSSFVNGVPTSLMLNLLSTTGSRVSNQDGGPLHIDAAFSGKTATETYAKAYAYILLSKLVHLDAGNELRRRRRR